MYVDGCVMIRYHTLFTHPALCYEDGIISKRIWDIFIGEQMDFAVILKISFLIFLRHKQEFMKMNFAEITQFCQTEQCLLFG